MLFRINLIHDIFGRERHKLHHENMGGVGSFEKECRTLYVGRLGKHYELESVLWSEFGEWGEIEVRCTVMGIIIQNETENAEQRKQSP